MRLLIVGTLEGHITTAGKIALSRGAKVAQAGSIDEAMNALRTGQGADLVMIDVKLDIGSMITRLDTERIAVPVVACGIGTDADAAVKAIEQGAKEYIPLPPDAELIAAVLEAVSEESSKIVFQDPVMDAVIALANKIAPSEASVLITGESGTGKELMANHIHKKSKRSTAQFVAVNCAAIPENLLESELFGHEKGAFTGAVQRRAGRFEQCDGGTLFLDEIGDMPSSVQVKLLRILQEGSFSRVGGNETLASDVRIVAATNKDLAAEVSEGHFREDLYYRLNVVEIALPPLRERPEDIPLLAEFFLQRLARKQGMARMRLSGEAVERLQKHHWPGNVRELENTIARACALSTTDLLLPEDIPFARSPFSEHQKIKIAVENLISVAPQTEEGLLEWFRSEVAHRVFEQCGNEMKTSAHRLGIPEDQLRLLLGNEA